MLSHLQNSTVRMQSNRLMVFDIRDHNYDDDDVWHFSGLSYSVTHEQLLFASL
jgi:hypothetical protein